MSLGPGARLGPYEVISAIGAGGMGEVYRAHDTKLGRDVALKVLPHELFFETPDQHLMVASYAVDGDSFRADKPRLWSDRRFVPALRNFRGFDLHPDGERFALAATPDVQNGAPQNKVVFIFNFFDELRRIAPPAKR